MSLHLTETREASSCPTPPPAEASPLASPANIGGSIDNRYRIVRTLGQGGMGRVVEVERTADRARLALKYCLENSLGKKRLRREARILRDLSHPHLVPIVDANPDFDPPYFVMPLAIGTLDGMVRNHLGDTSWSLDAFRQVCLGVEALHQVGVVHRDLKPANVLQLDDHRFVVADLGTAKREPRDSVILTRTCAIVGTLTYLAPEQLLPGGCRQADVRTDVYQLGKMLYHMFTGRSPAVLEAEYLPRALARTVLRATAVRPHDRYPDVSSLLDAVESGRDLLLAERSLHGEPQTLDQFVRRISKLLDAGCETSGALAKIIEVLEDLDDLEPDAVLDAWDALPTSVVVALAKAHPLSISKALGTYSQSLEVAVSHRPFDYADRVARRVRTLFDSTRSPEVRTRSIQGLLIASVVLHRFNAMSVLRQLLNQVRQPELILLVAEMLRAHRDYLQEIAHAVRLDRLHPVLRAVLDELEWIETVTF